MEKISSIVPRSRRVASGDSSTAPPVRPGAPAFGRAIGVSTAGVKDNITTAQRAIAEQEKMNENRRTSALMPKIVEDMNNRFFMQKPLPSDDVRAEMEPAVTGVPKPNLVRAMSSGEEVFDNPEEGDAEVEALEIAPVSGREPEEYVPPGTYLNVNV